MTDGDALLRVVLVDTADDAPRLVYADWLTEHGRPEHGDLIRAQVAMAQPETQADPARLRAVTLEDAWLRRFPDRFASLPVPVWQAGDWHWDRGFAERAHLPAAAFLAHTVAIFAAHPVTHRSLTDRSPRLDAGRWGWHLPYDRTPMSEVSAILPAKLFALLEGTLNPDDPAGDEFAYYAEAWLAWDALSRACVRYGRAKAGLPPLPGQDSGEHTIPHER